MHSSYSNIKDNRKRGSVADFFEEKMTENSKLCIVTAYFTVYAFDSLKYKLQNLKQVEFLFGEPTFIKTIKPENADSKVYKIENDQIQLSNKLRQKNIAKECSNWIKEKVKINLVIERGIGKVGWYGRGKFTANFPEMDLPSHQVHQQL